MSETLEEMYARLALGDGEEDAPELPPIPGTVIAHDSSRCLVGKFITDKPVNIQAMQGTLARIWRPVQDLERALHHGPWTFDQQLLVCARLEPDNNPHDVQLTHTAFWIQVYDLPPGYISEQVAKHVGNYIGQFLEADANNFQGSWKSYMRIRVLMDVTKPIKRKMKIRRPGENGTWVNFKYEKLPNFCFFCGLIGHAEHYCEKFYDFPDKSIEKLFRTWLRTPNRKERLTGGEKWLLPGPPSVMVGSSNKEPMQLDKETPQITVMHTKPVS
ncbi:hypothetical protein LguiA_030653 [Lonicera macranthoides]